MDATTRRSVLILNSPQFMRGIESEYAVEVGRKVIDYGELPCRDLLWQASEQIKNGHIVRVLMPTPVEIGAQAKAVSKAVEYLGDQLTIKADEVCRKVLRELLGKPTVLPTDIRLLQSTRAPFAKPLLLVCLGPAERAHRIARAFGLPETLIQVRPVPYEWLTERNKSQVSAIVYETCADSSLYSGLLVEEQRSLKQFVGPKLVNAFNKLVWRDRYLSRAISRFAAETTLVRQRALG